MEVTPLVEQFTEMMELGIFVDPLLVNHYGRKLPPELNELVQGFSENFYNRYVHLAEFSMSLGDIPFSTHLMRLCITDSLQSTAHVIAYETIGSLELSESIIREAASRLAKFISHSGVERLYVLYFRVSGHDMMQPLHFHKNVSETEFRQGFLHHPYLPEVLDIYLLIGLARGSLRYKQDGKGRIIQLTRNGSARYRIAHQILVEAGYIAKRVTLSYVYQFDSVEDWDEMCAKVWPNGTQLRDGFVQWLDIQLGDHVLEAACGTGGLTFDSKLYKRVGNSGLLTAIDVSSGMLKQAKRKWEHLGSPASVVFQQASIEHLPYRDRVFDACVGSSFLHFVDAKQALAEMKRVVIPGGTVAILQGLQFDLMQPFFRDWFDPIFQLAKRRNAEAPHNYLPLYENIIEWFHDAGLTDVTVNRLHGVWLFDDPEIVVQHMLRGVSFFQTELMEIPWDDRRTLISELIARGRDILRQYAFSERFLIVPSVMVKARRPLN